ncbi:hypothetical protein ACJ4V0_15840 [Phreatobacter sp. HK31-P]
MATIRMSGTVLEDGAPRQWEMRWSLFSSAADWIAEAKAGDATDYYQGDLARDRAVGLGSLLPFTTGAMLNSIAQVLLDAAAANPPLVRLAQVRVAPGVRRYMAWRTSADAASFVAAVRERAAPAKRAA